MNGRDSRRNHSGNYNNYGYHNGNNRSSGQTRNHVIPDEPPYTAYIGNAPDTMVQGDFEHQLFVGLKVKQVRLVRDRQTDRFRGFAYVDFEDADSLRSAIALDGTCVNDRPIRIDVASRPLGATKSNGFRKQSGFEPRNGSGQASGYSNNRSMAGFRHNERDKTQREIPSMIDGYYENGYNNDSPPCSSASNKINLNDQTNSRHNSEKQSQGQQESTSRPPPLLRNISDEVFITPDTPTTNENENYENKDDTTTMTSMIRQPSRNWADCPIDDSVVDTSPPPSANNTLTTNDIDDFQVVRNRTPKSRTNQNTSSRSMGNQSMRGRNNGNYSRGSHTPGDNGRQYYDQMSSSYTNQYYHQHNTQIPSHSLSMNFPNRHQQSSGNRQRLNSNRSNNNNNQTSQDDQSNRNGKRLTSTTSSSSYDINPTSSENRPRLQLLPRSQKLSSSTDDNQPSEPATRNSSIFGSGKPRDERDPKIAELTKHIEEVVEKEQHLARTISTTSNDSTLGINKPVRILTAKSEYSIEH